MRNIYCVAFEPAPDRGSVGGVDWRVQMGAGEALYFQRLADPNFNNCRLAFFDMKVPEGMPSADVTALVDSRASERDYVPAMYRDPVDA